MSKSLSKQKIRELINSSPKKYTAILVSDSEDENQKKALLVPQEDLEDSEEDFEEEFGESCNSECFEEPIVSISLSDSDDEDYIPQERKPRSVKPQKQSQPVIIVSPTKLSKTKAVQVARQAQIEAMIQKNAERTARKAEREKKRMEEEAIQRARAEMEREKKERVQRILAEIREKKKQQEQQQFVTVYYTPESDDEYAEDEEEDYEDSFEEEAEEEDSSEQNELMAEIEKLQGIAGKIEKYGKRLQQLSTTLSPKKKHSHHSHRHHHHHRY